MSKRTPYAGVGFRRTPDDVREAMRNMAYQMSQSGTWHLRSGFAEGADKAFGLGASLHAELTGDDRWTMYLPWQGYNGAPREGDSRFVVPFASPELARLASSCHPAWPVLSQPVRAMMLRNAAVVAGPGMDDPAACLIGWTERARRQGGTGHAMRVAEMIGVPVFDLASARDRRLCLEFVNSYEERSKTINL